MHFRFIHAADLHLDSPFRGLTHLPSAIFEEVRKSTFQSLDALIQLAIRERVDFVCIAGDVYDLTDRSLYAQVALQKAAIQLANKGIHLFLIHGNHDPEDGGKARLDWPETVHFFPDSHVMGIPFYKEGQELARIYGRSYPTKSFTERIAKEYVRDADVPFAIALYHTNLDGNADHETYAPSTRQELLAQEMDYWALGHIHQPAILHQDPWIVYSGNLQGRSIKETGPKGCFLVEVSGNQVTMTRFHELNAIRWEKVTVQLSQVEDEQGLLDAVQEQVMLARENVGNKPMIVRLHVEGQTPMHKRLKDPQWLADWQDTLREMFSTLDPWVWMEQVKVHTQSDMDWEQWKQSDSFVGDLLRLAQSYQQRDVLPEGLVSTLGMLFQHRTAKRYLSSLTDEEVRQMLKEAEQLAVYMLVDKGETG